MKQIKPKQGQPSRNPTIGERSKTGRDTPTKKGASQFDSHGEESAADSMLSDRDTGALDRDRRAD